MRRINTKFSITVTSQGWEKQTWEGDLGAQQSQLFLQLRAGYTDVFCDSLCLICTVYIFFRMYDMDSLITYFKITRSPIKTYLQATSSPHV